MFSKTTFKLLAVLAVIAAVLAASKDVAHANERHFTYTYESAVLPPGARELEVWTSPRLGRDAFYSRFDERLELEVGVTERLLTALYLNFTAISAESTAGVMESDVRFAGVSSEWKYKLLDPVVDALGVAVYGEVTAATDELELEAKLILDRYFGRLLVACNLVVENEWEIEPDATTRELILELDVGATYAMTSRVSAGVELRSHNEFPAGEGFEHSALFAGPVVSYRGDGWWVAATLMPQLPALKGHEGATGPDLHEHERINGRLLFAVHL